MSNWGSYTFQANTLYTILFKLTQGNGGHDIYFAVRQGSSWSGQSRTRSTFPSQFFTSYTGTIPNLIMRYNPATQLNLIHTEPEVSNNFRIVRLQRQGDVADYINIYELQVWIGGVNVAVSGTATAFDEATFIEGVRGGPEYLNDDDFSYLYHSEVQKTDNWCQIELAEDYNILQLQSVVIYNRIDTATAGLKRIKNCRIDFMNLTGEIIYSTSSIPYSQADNFYIRFDGPDINNVPSSLFTTSPPSASQIKFNR